MHDRKNEKNKKARALIDCHLVKEHTSLTGSRAHFTVRSFPTGIAYQTLQEMFTTVVLLYVSA